MKKTCKDCGVEKPVSDFWRRGRTLFQSYCKPCQSVRNKAWELAHPGDSTARVKRNQDMRRDYTWEVKRNAVCADCGGSFHPVQMQFDHVRGEKVDDVSRLTKTSSLEAIKAEIEKCEVVCANCHAMRTYERATG